MKVNYNGIIFDSELEVAYYQWLQEIGIEFVYQDKYKKNPIPINLGRRKTYTPDFITYDWHSKTITIIELKGYAKWTANEDNNIMDFMKHQVAENPSYLIDWLKSNNLYREGYKVEYARLKHLKGTGFVDYNYKNPNSLSNKRKAKIQELESELKELKQFKKETLRYFKLYLSDKKKTQKQYEYLGQYLEKMNKEIENE